MGLKYNNNSMKPIYLFYILHKILYFSWSWEFDQIWTEHESSKLLFYIGVLCMVLFCKLEKKIFGEGSLFLPSSGLLFLLICIFFFFYNVVYFNSFLLRVYFFFFSTLCQRLYVYCLQVAYLFFKVIHESQM